MIYIKEWFRGETFDNRKNGNYECIRQDLEKPFRKLKTLNEEFQLMRCLSGGSGCDHFYLLLLIHGCTSFHFRKNCQGHL